jgi:hypothetical protein
MYCFKLYFRFCNKIKKILSIMKRAIAYFIIAVFGIVMMTSCKTKESCPAYGQQTEKNGQQNG